MGARPADPSAPAATRGPVPVVVLAAGRSSRMGEPKGLVLVEGRPWIAHQLDALQGRPPRRVILVLGHDRARYLEAVLGLGRRVDLVTNPDPDRGPFSSLQVGLSAVDAEQSTFVLPVDVPVPSQAVWDALEVALGGRETATGAALGPGSVEAAIPVHDGRGGHPVLLGPAFIARLVERDPARSRLDEELRALPPPKLARVPVEDPRIRLNLNAPGDWGKVAKGG